MTQNSGLQAASAPSKEKRSLNIYKVLFGVILTVVVSVVFPVIGSKYGVVAPLADKAMYVLLITTAGLAVKIIIGDIVAGEFLFHKFGYDNCVVAFGALLTAMALQMLSPVDLFPGFQTVYPFSLMLEADRAKQLVLLFIASLLAMLFTGLISANIKHKNPACPSLLSLVNFFTGTILLSVYILILITKG